MNTDMKKQTAVEWFAQWLNDNPVVREKDYYAAIEWAKALEKEQIIDAHGLKREHGIDKGVDYWITKCGLEYYDQTYGSDK